MSWGSLAEVRLGCAEARRDMRHVVAHWLRYKPLLNHFVNYRTKRLPWMGLWQHTSNTAGVAARAEVKGGEKSTRGEKLSESGSTHIALASINSW